jgi:hypothetical protein
VGSQKSVNALELMQRKDRGLYKEVKEAIQQINSRNR